MDPQQEIFSALLVELQKLGYDVYDGALPPDDTPYPFIYLADSQQLDDKTKNSIMATVYQTVHVWHNNAKKRGSVSAMLYDIKRVAYSLQDTPSFRWIVGSVDQRILPDTTTKTPLLHGIIEFEFKMTGGIRT